MEIRNSAQALFLLKALGIGALLGLAYDVLRPPRHRGGKFAAAAIDALFCAGAFWLVFCFAMASPFGKLGLWEPAAVLLGFLAYMNLFSPAFLSVYVSALNAVGAGLVRCKSFLKKSLSSAKYFFKKVRECFIIKE